MNQVICPIDQLPCEADCPDRYHDTPEGGCFLTTAMELGFKMAAFQNGDCALVYTPKGKEVPN